MDLTDKSIQIFYNDNFAKNAQIVIEKAQKNYAECSMEVLPMHLNGNGVVMGGALYTLADYAFAVASNAETNCTTVTLNSTINFLSPAITKKLIAKAVVKKDGKSTCYGTVEIGDENGKIFAIFSGTGFRKSN